MPTANKLAATREVHSKHRSRIRVAENHLPSKIISYCDKLKQETTSCCVFSHNQRLEGNNNFFSQRKPQALAKLEAEEDLGGQTIKMNPQRNNRQSAVCRRFSATLLLAAAAFSFSHSSRDDNKLAFVDCAKLPDIYWNSSNPIFRIDNTDHIFDVNKKQHDHDQVDLVCPQPQQPVAVESTNTAGNDSVAQGSSNQLQERYIIYSVSKEEYDTCRLNSNSGRVVAVCDQQQGKNRPPFTVTFRSFTPQPNGLEFKAGQDYYFISALIGHEHDPKRRFSPCSEQNMKVIFKVCCKAPNSGNALDSSSSSSSISIGGSASRLQSVAAASSQLGRQSTRAPSAAAIQRPNSVITLRPSLINGNLNHLQPKQKPSNSFGNVNQEQQQPVTVLPIEVLQPQSTSTGHSSTNEDPQTSSSSGEQSTRDSNNNDIQNDGKEPAVATPLSSGPAVEPSPPQSLNNLLVRPYETYPSSNSRRPAPQLPLLPFDPTASPEVLRGNYVRYTPTPLPAELTKPARSWPHHQSSSYQPYQHHQQASSYQQQQVMHSVNLRPQQSSSSSSSLSRAQPWGSQQPTNRVLASDWSSSNIGQWPPPPPAPLSHQPHIDRSARGKFYHDLTAANYDRAGTTRDFNLQLEQQLLQQQQRASSSANSPPVNCMLVIALTLALTFISLNQSFIKRRR